MSELLQFLELLKAFNDKDNAAREAAEKTITAAAYANPETFVNICMQAIEAPTVAKEQRAMATILLKKLLYSSSGQGNVYTKLNPQAQEAFRRKIFILMTQVEEDHLKLLISDLIGSVASSVLEDQSIPVPPKNRWPDLIPHLCELYAHKGTPGNVSAVFDILDCLMANSMTLLNEYVPDFVKLFVNTLTQHPTRCKMSALEAFVTMIQAVKRKELKYLRVVRPHIFTFIEELYNAKDEDELQKALGSMIDIAECEPAFFKPEIDKLLVLATRLQSTVHDLESPLRTNCIEMILPVIENFPEIIQENDQRLVILFKLVLNTLTVENDVDDSWKSPPDGFNDELEEDDDQTCVKFGIQTINQLFTIVGHKKMLVFLSTQLAPLLASLNWIDRHSALMILSQTGEYMEEDFTHVDAVMDIVEKNVKDQNPRVRYACCHLLGQFADDLSTKFQEKYHQRFFLMVIPLLKDSVPRVVAHSLAAMSNFLEYSTKEQIAPHFETLFTGIYHWLSNGICFVREASLSALSAMCEGAPEFFTPHLDQLMQVAFSILKTANQPIYKTLKGNTVELATTLIKNCPRPAVEKYIDPVIQEMIKIVQSDISYDGVDPQKSFLLSGFQRLAPIVPDKLVPYLDMIMASLLNMAKASLSETANEGVSARSSVLEETDIALNLMGSFLLNLSDYMPKYETQIYELTNVIVDKTFDKETRITALSVLGLLAKLYKNKPTESNQVFLRKTVAKIWSILDEEEDPEVMTDIIATLQKVLKYSENCFTEDELVQFYEKCKQLIFSSIKRKETLKEDFDEEDDKQDIHNAMQETEEIEHYFQIEVANLIGCIFKSHKTKSLKVFGLALEQLIGPALANPQSVKFGLFLIDDAIEHLGEQIPPQTLQNFLNTLLKFSQDSDLVIRQSSIFGLGITALTLGSKFEQFFPTCYNAVLTGGAIPQTNDESPTEYRALQENCASAQGKMIQVMWDKLPAEKLQECLNRWLQGFPMVTDHKEGIINMEMLMNILKAHPVLILGPKLENMAKLLSTFSSVYHQSKISNKKIDEEIETLLKSFLANEQTKSLIVGLQLSDEVKTLLNHMYAK